MNDDDNWIDDDCRCPQLSPALLAFKDSTESGTEQLGSEILNFNLPPTSDNWANRVLVLVTWHEIRVVASGRRHLANSISDGSFVTGSREITI